MSNLLCAKENGDSIVGASNTATRVPIYDYEDIVCLTNKTIADACLAALGGMDVIGVRYRLVKSISLHHLLSSYLCRIFQKGFWNTGIPLETFSITKAEAKKWGVDHRTAFVIKGAKEFEGTDNMLFVPETAPCEVPKVMANSPTEGLMITGYKLYNITETGLSEDYCRQTVVGDLINRKAFVQHTLTYMAVKAVQNTVGLYDSEEMNEEQIEDVFRRTITISNQFLKDFQESKKV